MCSGTDSAATVKGNTTSAQDTQRRQSQADKWRSEWQAHGVRDPNPEFEGTSPEGTPVPTKESKTDANSFAERNIMMQGFTLKPPDEAPDATDELLQKRRASQATSLMLGRGRKSTMPGANYSDLQVGKTKLFGGGGS